MAGFGLTWGWGRELTGRAVSMKVGFALATLTAVALGGESRACASAHGPVSCERDRTPEGVSQGVVMMPGHGDRPEGPSSERGTQKIGGLRGMFRGTPSLLPVTPDFSYMSTSPLS